MRKNHKANRLKNKKKVRLIQMCKNFNQLEEKHKLHCQPLILAIIYKKIRKFQLLLLVDKLLLKNEAPLCANSVKAMKKLCSSNKV